MKRMVVLIFCATALSACTPSVETRVISLGGMAGEPMRSYALASLEGASSELLLAQRLITEKLAESSLTVSSSPELFLEVTVAARPASSVLASAGKQGSKVLAPAAKKKALAKCARVDVRLGVTVTRLSDGTQAYRAAASETHCNPAMNSVLPALVNAVLADLPKVIVGTGSERAYVLKRKLR